MQLVAGNGGQGEADAGGRDAPGEPYDGQGPAGPQQVPHAHERRLGVHVVQ